MKLHAWFASKLRFRLHPENGLCCLRPPSWWPHQFTNMYFPSWASARYVCVNRHTSFVMKSSSLVIITERCGRSFMSACHSDIKLRRFISACPRLDTFSSISNLSTRCIINTPSIMNAAGEYCAESCFINALSFTELWTTTIVGVSHVPWKHFCANTVLLKPISGHPLATRPARS